MIEKNNAFSPQTSVLGLSEETKMVRCSKALFMISAASVLSTVIGTASAAYTISGVPVTDEGSTTDLLDASNGGGAGASSDHTPCCSSGQGESTPITAIGGSDTFTEPTHFIFDDGSAPTDTLGITAGHVFELTSYDVILQSDGNGSTYRGATHFVVLAGASATTLLPIDSGDLGTGAYDSLAASGGSPRIDIHGTTDVPNVDYVELQLTRASSGGPRIIEVDGFGTVPEPTTLGLTGLVGLALLRRRA